MHIEHGSEKTEFGFGVVIRLTGNEVAEAIDLWLAKTGNVIVTGPRTIAVNGQLCGYGAVYVDPSGSVRTKDRVYSGRGESATRKYEAEYSFYRGFMKARSTHEPKTYSEWERIWEKEIPENQQTILARYAEALGYSVKPLTSASQKQLELTYTFDVLAVG